MGTRAAAAAALLLAALCSVAAAAEKPGRWKDLGDGFSVLETGSTYRSTSARPSGSLASGQAADIALAAIGFDETGGPLLFNHPGGIASDGTHLLLADRNNNRVLVWSRLPAGNTKPDLVLGQKSFRTNAPGTGLGQLNWPVAVAAAAGKVVVADTYNDRLLIWNRFPTRSGQPADLVIRGERRGADPKRLLAGPWGVWTDGRRLAASNTWGSGGQGFSGSVLVWNGFPARDDQPADLVLRGDLGTPRTITSDGKSLIVGDHNPRRGPTVQGGQGSFVWRTWPARDDQPYDFFLADPKDERGAWPSGTFTADGKLVLVATRLYVWSSLPSGPGDAPDLVLEGDAPRGPGRPAEDAFSYFGGDGSGAAVAGSRLYVSLANRNHVVAFKRFPASAAARPDFAIGSPDLRTNTLLTNYFVTNPVPVTDGRSLFVSSDFDRRLSVWKRLPDQSGARPDLVYRLPEGGWQSAVHGGVLALAGREALVVWRRLPFGQKPDLYVRRSLGSVVFGELRGVALDDRYLYVGDKRAGKVYVFEGIPSPSSEPKLTLSVPGVTRLSSDGTYLAVNRTEGEGSRVWIYRVADLASPPRQVPARFNLPEMALVARGALLVAETPANRVHVWKDVSSALAGREPDAVLGAPGREPVAPSIARDRLFWPGALAFDGSYLWVGEFKFSGRLLRYSVR